MRTSNANEFGASSTGTFVLLDVPGTPTVQVTPGSTTAQVTIQVPNNDGYGRAPETSAYGFSVINNIPFELGYRVQLYSDGEAVQGPQDTDLKGSTQSTVVVFSGLVVHSVYTVVVTARNVVGNGGTAEDEFSTVRSDETRLRLRAYLGGAVR